MFRSLILAAVLLACAPVIANAGEITLLPSVKLQIGDRDGYGNYWTVAAGATVITGVVIMNGAITAGIAMITAGIAVGINAAGIAVVHTSAAIAKAGTIAVAAGAEALAAGADMVTGTTN